MRPILTVSSASAAPDKPNASAAPARPIKACRRNIFYLPSGAAIGLLVEHVRSNKLSHSQGGRHAAQECARTHPLFRTAAIRFLEFPTLGQALTTEAANASGRPAPARDGPPGARRAQDRAPVQRETRKVSIRFLAGRVGNTHKRLSAVEMAYKLQSVDRRRAGHGQSITC